MDGVDGDSTRGKLFSRLVVGLSSLVLGVLLLMEGYELIEVDSRCIGLGMCEKPDVCFRRPCY